MINDTAIIILNYKNYDDTINCINSIFFHTPKKIFTIIVVDNDSDNDSLAKINESFAFQKYIKVEKYDIEYRNSKNVDILLVQNDLNYGYAYGNNVGLKIAYGLEFKYLMVLNNDTLFVENCIPKLQCILEKDDTVLCVGPLLLKGDNVSIDYNCARRRPTYFDLFLDSHFGNYFRTNTWRKEYYFLKKKTKFKLPY